MIWIRCEAGDKIGYGHLGRCVALSEELQRRGQEVTFIGLHEKVEGTVVYDSYKPTVLPYDIKIEDNPYKPLIRDEFARLSKVGQVWQGDCGQSMLENLFTGQRLRVFPKVNNQYPYYDFVMRHSLYEQAAAEDYAAKMVNYRSELASRILLSTRPATIEDRLFVFNLRNSKAIRDISHNSAPLSWEAHKEWFAQSKVNILYEAEKKIGVYCIKDGYISLYFLPEHQGRNYGKLVLESIKEPVKASIKPDNYRSLTLFTKAGFKFDGKDYCRN